MYNKVMVTLYKIRGEVKVGIYSVVKKNQKHTHDYKVTYYHNIIIKSQ